MWSSLGGFKNASKAARPMLQDAATNPFSIQSAFGEQFFRIAVLDEAIRQPEVEHGGDQARRRQEFIHRATGAAADDVFLDGNEELMGARQLRDERLVERLHEAHVG